MFTVCVLVRDNDIDSVAKCLGSLAKLTWNTFDASSSVGIDDIRIASANADQLLSQNLIAFKNEIGERKRVAVMNHQENISDSELYNRMIGIKYPDLLPRKITTKYTMLLRSDVFFTTPLKAWLEHLERRLKYTDAMKSIHGDCIVTATSIAYEQPLVNKLTGYETRLFRDGLSSCSPTIIAGARHQLSR